MTIDVGWLEPPDQWDCTLVSDLLDGTLYPHGLKVEHHQGFPNSDGAIIVCPGRYWASRTDQINQSIQRFQWMLLLRTSDEEDLFDIGDVVHENARFWVQTPRGGRDYGDARLFGVGYSPHFRDLPVDPPVKDTDVYLAAQKSNALTGRHFKVYERRAAFFKALRRVAGSKVLVERDGFAQGDRAEYVAGMLAAKVAPAPTGMVSVDSFRFWEALQSGAIPVADTVSDADGLTDYWVRLFGHDTPFPILRDVEHLPMIVDGLIDGWPANANRVQAWWYREKRQYALDLKIDLEALGAL